MDWMRIVVGVRKSGKTKLAVMVRICSKKRAADLTIPGRTRRDRPSGALSSPRARSTFDAPVVSALLGGELSAPSRRRGGRVP